MTLTWIWNVLGSATTLALALLVIGKADAPFERAVFVMGLIAFHRLRWQQATVAQSVFMTAWRHEVWFRSLQLQSVGPVTLISPVLQKQLGEFSDDQLVAAKEELD